MKNTVKKSFVLASSLIAIGSATSQAHTVALGWEVLPGGDVQFYNAHWHNQITTTQNTGLFIDGTEYKFTGIENNVDSRTGLDGAIFNPTYYTWDSTTGTLAYIPAQGDNDWLTVRVSGLGPGEHTFATTNVALTQWNIPDVGGSITVTLPPPPPPTPTTTAIPEPSQSLTLLGLLASGLLFGRRRQA